MQPKQNKSHDFSDLEEILITGRLRKTYEAFGVTFELQTLLKSEEKLISSISDSKKQTFFYMYYALLYSLRSINLKVCSLEDRVKFCSIAQPIVLEILYYNYYDLNMQYFNACELLGEYQLSDSSQYKFKVLKSTGLELPTSEFREIHWSWYYYHQVREERMLRWEHQDNSLYVVAATSSELAKVLRKEFIEERKKFDDQFRQIYGGANQSKFKVRDLEENLRTHETESQTTAHRYSSEFEQLLAQDLSAEKQQLTRQEYEQLKSLGINLDNVAIVDTPMIQSEYAEELQNFPQEWVEEYQEE